MAALSAQKNASRDENCSVTFHGAWWYEFCADFSLNGRNYDMPARTSNDGIFRYFFGKKVEFIETSFNENSTKLLTITKQNVCWF